MERIQENLVEKSLAHTDEQLAYVQKVLGRHTLNSVTHQQILKRMKSVEQRSHDRSLYLGVVGEFNSGKSTFINALLRDPLLKARMVATTAAGTWIVHGKELAIEVTVRTGQSVALCESAGRCPFHRWFPQIADLSVREMIPVVTDEAQLASLVSRVTISHPAPFLADSVVVIDTPGTNATHQEHGEITKKIVENEVDMAVILIPANQPVSMSLVGFLNGPLQPLLRRCVFVLTKMDLVPEREQQAHIQFVTERLSEVLGRQDVTVLASAPQIVLDLADPDAEEEVSPGHQPWGAAFSDLEVRLHRRMRELRDLVITEHVMRLLTDLFGLLEAEVKQAQQRHLDKGTLIRQETIRDLQTFLDEQEQSVQEIRLQKVRQAKFGVSSEVVSQKTSGIEAIRTGLFATTNSGGLKAYVGSQVEPLLQSSADCIQSRVREEGDGLSHFMKEAAANVNRRFNEEYTKLSHLAVVLSSQKIQVDAGVSVNAPSVVQNAATAATSLSDDESGRVSLGVLGGAIIGAILLPGIGLVIGPFIGGWLSSLFGPSLSQQQSDVWEKLSPKVLEYYDQIERSAVSAIDEAGSKWKSALSLHLKQNGDNYDREVAKIKKEHEQERKAVSALQMAAKQDLDEISKRKSALEATLRRLNQS